MVRFTATRQAVALAVVALIAAGLTHQKPAAADSFGQGSADITTLLDGAPGVDETQTLTINATGGTFTLTYLTDTTAPIAFDAPAEDVGAALVTLPSIDTGNVTVTGDPAPYQITFTGDLATTDAAELTADTTGLTGDTPTATITTTTPGQAPANEIQQLRVQGFAGTYTLTYDSQTTPPLAIDLTADDLHTALAALPNLEPTDIAITGGPGDRTGAHPYTITFTGTLTHTNLPALVADSTQFAALAGTTIAQLPAGATPTVWATQTGQVVGNGLTGWFWWSPAGGYVELPESFLPHDVNNRGQIVGQANFGGPVERPALWTIEDGLTDLGPPDAPNRRGHAYAINDRGSVVGWSESATSGQQHALFWSPDDGYTDIGTLANGYWAYGIGLNENDEAYGIADASVGSNVAIFHAFYWSTQTGMIDLGTLGGDAGGETGNGTYINDINDGGVIVGSSRTATNTERAFSWTPSGGMVDIGAGDASYAQLVNNAGQVAGRSDADGSAFIWSAADGLTDLGNLGGQGRTLVNVLGESGAILGTSAAPGPHNDDPAFYWSPEVGMVSLENPSAPSAASAARPFALSDSGEILAFTNLPAESARREGAAAAEPVGIVYWPDAGPGQPDQAIRAQTPRTFVGTRIYNTTGAGQVRTTTTRLGATAAFVVRSTNTGARSARFTLRGPASSPEFDVRYLVGGTDITRAVTAGTYRTPRLAPQDHHDLTIRVAVRSATPVGRTTTIRVRATNTADASRTDTAKAKVSTRR